MPLPRCPVRDCGLALSPAGRSLACPAGHSFDLAREGYLNLLQPQDRRSKAPGDAREAVAARGRALDAGAGDELTRVVLELVDELAARRRLDALDVGCGVGAMLRALASHRDVEACGVDLSVDAARAAARACPGAFIVVANADRGLPWPDASFDVVLSITARRPIAEMRRVIREDGLLVVALPAPDDLTELRAEVLGSASAQDRLTLLRAEAAPAFTEAACRPARARLRLPPGVQRDLLLSTYRGSRNSQQERVAALVEADVTMSHDVVAWRPRGSNGGAA